MISLVAGILLSLPGCQEPDPVFVPGDVTPTGWSLSGPADVADNTELFLRARRLLRRLDPSQKLFMESPSDVSRIRALVEIRAKRFETGLSAGTPGRYMVVLSNDDKILHQEKLALGSITSLFTRGPDDVKSLLEIIDKAVELLDHLERVISRQADHSAKARDEFHKRVNALSQKLDELFNGCDLTGTINALQEVCWHIRNAQVWDEKFTPPPGGNDPPRKMKKVFTDEEMTIEKLRNLLAAMPGIISSEIKLSTTLILERLIVQAGDVERRRDSMRSAARAASKLAEAAPVADKDLVRLLDLASDRASKAEEVREHLLQAGQALLVK